MNNILTIHQRVIARWLPEVDLNDAAIVSHIVRLEQSQNPKIARYRITGGFCWVDFKTLLRENPLLPFKYDMLKKRLAHLVEIGVLSKHVGETGSRRSFFKTSEEYHTVLSFWEEHDKEAVERVYGWVLENGVIRYPDNSVPSIEITDYPMSGEYITSYPKQDPKVNTKQPAARKKRSGSSADTKHPTLGLPMKQSTYDKLCGQYSQRLVDWAMEEYQDWLDRKGKPPGKEYAACAKTWIKKCEDPREPWAKFPHWYLPMSTGGGLFDDTITA